MPELFLKAVRNCRHVPVACRLNLRSSKRLQRSPSLKQAEPCKAPATAQERIDSPGKPLEPSTRSFFEPRFAHDFGHVKVHSDTSQDRSRSYASDASKKLRDFLPDNTIIRRWTQDSRSTQLSLSELGLWSSLTGAQISNARIHSDRISHLVALSHNAKAVTIGTEIFLGEHSQTPGILAHEMAHLAQSRLIGPFASKQDREKEASSFQRSVLQGQPIPIRLSGPSSEAMTHPAERVLIRAGIWLLKKTTRTISKHIAKHGRRIADKAVHSIFRMPREIRFLVNRTIAEAKEVVRKAAGKGASEILEEGGVRVFQQAGRTPGKVRYVVEKDFGRAIGTRGEKILRVVLDMSGRIVTAFPADRFLSLGLGTAAIGIFQERTAMASEQIRSRIEAEENRPTNWTEEILDILNPVSGGSLNESEDLLLDIDRTIDRTTADVIKEIEDTEKIKLAPEKKEAIKELVKASIGSPMELENSQQ